MINFIKEFIFFEHNCFIIIAGYIIAIATLICALKGIVEFAELFRTRTATTPSFKITRRNILKVAGCTALLNISGFLGKKLCIYIQKKRLFLKIRYNRDIIANSKSKVIHLRGVSNGLLPSAKRQTRQIDLDSFYPYRGYERRIFEALGVEAIKQKNDDLAVYLYKNAIENSPLSYHLYDKLTRIYGRQKEYNKIYQLFVGALDNIKNTNISKKHYRRAKMEFQFRLNRTIKRSGSA